MVDEEWYLKHYRIVGLEIASGLARDATDHYARFGKFRGYLPQRGAPRPNNAAAYHSRFGGLWTDLANAHDIVEGKLKLGWISAVEAEQLSHWIDNGFLKISAALEPEQLRRAQEELSRLYNGQSNAQLFDCVADGPTPSTFRPSFATLPAKALCVHWLYPGLRDAMFSPKISRFLALLFERPALATQTLGFYRGSGQGGHQDSAFVGYTLPMQFAASWIALADVQPTAGELFYYPKSHRVPDFLFGGDFKNVGEFERLRSNDLVESEKRQYDAAVNRKVADLKRESFLPKAGDALIWSADLVHGGSPVSSDLRRESLVTHYCPAELAPLYFEAAEHPIRRHISGNYYSTYNYDEEMHVDA